MSEPAAQAKDKLASKQGAGNVFLGWINLPVDYDEEEISKSIYVTLDKVRGV